MQISVLTDRSTWILETLERKLKGNKSFKMSTDIDRQCLSNKDLHEVVGKIQTIHKPRFGGIASGKFILEGCLAEQYACLLQSKDRIDKLS